METGLWKYGQLYITELQLSITELQLSLRVTKAPCDLDQGEKRRSEELLISFWDERALSLSVIQASLFLSGPRQPTAAF